MPPIVRLPPIYAITDLATAGASDHASIAGRLFSVGVALVQVREKTRSDREFLPDLEACATLGRTEGATVLVNDRTDLARVAGTGVHLGAQDLPAELARPLLVPGALIGVSTHDDGEAAAAFSAQDPDYVAFGPVFESGTKTTRSARGLDALARVAAMKTRPLVAIGGITAETVAQVLDAGADSAAMVAGLLAGGRIEENGRAALDAARRRDFAGRIYLVGFMACGKTTIGRRIAERLHVPFVDLDSEIERTSGLTVRALFESAGEAVFRERESVFLEATAALPNAVIATGGGAYVRDDNRRRIASLGTAVFLDPPLSTLISRLSGKGDRPLFRDTLQAAALWAEREPFYRMGSLCVPLNDGTVETAADRVLIALDKQRRPEPS
ncbi:MAG: thiamine phosphate synthase [Acidobacteriota bacterium]|nr:thiamine phosphate synthase [Acidobacteriota bacterium]